tara:strand:+ start:920 stop:1087 length:168 start_codon:yes stop_codon:yes gene_type:complete
MMASTLIPKRGLVGEIHVDAKAFLAFGIEINIAIREMLERYHDNHKPPTFWVGHR